MATEYLNNKFLESILKKYQTSRQEKIRFSLIIEDITLSNEKRVKLKKNVVHDLNQYTIEHNKASSDFEDSQKALAKAFYLLAENIMRCAKEIITDQDDAIQEGVMICFDKIHRFNPDKGKAFNFFTTCVINQVRQSYRTSKNYKLLKEKYKDYLQSKMENIMIYNGKEKLNYKSNEF